jgi:hypothetical protein
VREAINPTFTSAGQIAHMDPSSIPIFNLAEQRLAWTDRRQGVLARNIANLNTPNWQAKDLHPFAQFLTAATPPAWRAPMQGIWTGHRPRAKCRAVRWNRCSRSPHRWRC